MEILSPIPLGSGSHVLHQSLARAMPGYELRPYSKYLELAPFLLPLKGLGSKPDIIHTALDHACFFKRRGIPLVATVHNYVLDPFMIPFSTIAQRVHYASDLRLFTNLSLSAADKVTTVSQYLAGKIAKQTGTLPQVIYNGVDENLFHPQAANYKKAPFRVFFCGNLSRRKRFGLLPVLADRLGAGFEIHYTAGFRQNRSFLSPSSNAARLVSHGRVTPDKMPELFRRVDLLFMPSVREGFGLCVAEAMATGLPVVATRTSATPELVKQGEGGILCEIDDVDAFSEAIEAIAGDRQRCRQMGDFNRSQVEKYFTLSLMVKRYRALFEQLLDSVRKGH